MPTLTVSQLAAICTGNPQPPWHLKDLAQKFTELEEHPLSVRTALTKISATNMVFYVQVRDVTLLKGVTTLPQLQAAWVSSAPSKAALTQLSKTLSSVGAAITYVSHDWRTVAIFGTSAQLANIPILELDRASGLVNVGTGLLGVAGTLLAVGSVPSPATPAVLVAAAVAGFGAGLILGIGVFQLQASGPTTAVVSPATNTTSAPNTGVIGIYGDPPPDVAPNNPPTTPVDVSSLSDAGPPVVGGTETSGTETSGTETSGTEMSGTETSGTETDGGSESAPSESEGPSKTRA